MDKQLRTIAFFLREGARHKWGGDLLAIGHIMKGLEHFGIRAIAAEDFGQIKDADLIFLSNTILDLNPEYHLLKLANKPYGIICFHEDRSAYMPISIAFFYYVQACLEGLFSIDRLLMTPHTLSPFIPTVKPSGHGNYAVLKDALLCVANAPTEAGTIKRDCPEARIATIQWAAGLARELPIHPDRSFIEWTGLESKSYILQIGRFESRKNQLATILATLDFPEPLVFITTRSIASDYQSACLEALKKWRKGKTLIISQDIPSQKLGAVEILQMPNEKKLSIPLLASAYSHAALHLHVPFHELPGYTYLEGIKLGVPTVASSWTTLKDYFTNPHTGAYDLDDKRVVYAEPTDIAEIAEKARLQLGRRLVPLKHPTFERTEADVAKEILEQLSKILSKA